MKKNIAADFSIRIGRDTTVFHGWYLKYHYIEISGAPARYGAWIGFKAKEIVDPWRRGHYRYTPAHTAACSCTGLEQGNRADVSSKKPGDAGSHARIGE